MNEDLDQLLQTAREAARSAARAIGDIYRQYLGGERIDIRDKGVDDPVTAADLSANRIITRTLKEAFPHHAILTEEEPHTWSETGHEWVWMIDPLDGTKDFIKANGEFVTMVGLAHNAEPTIGVVIEPATGLELFACKDRGAFKGSLSQVEKASKLTAPPAPDLKGLRIAISRSHRDSKVDDLIQLLDGSIDLFYSATLLCTGRADFLH